ncbi:MAG: threonine-phosphate decarboxylase CobD, partial [Acidimicrobiales bacterium]
QPAWSVNGLAAEALPELLDTVDLPGWSLALAGLRVQLSEVLCRHGFVPEPSDANFVLVGKAGDLRSRLAPHGVAVRDCSSFGLEGRARIAVPGPDDLARLDAALAAAFPEGGDLGC